MSASEVLHRVLYRALIDIRAEAHARRNARIFELADLFHTIPLQLELVARGEGSYPEVLAALRARAAEKGRAEELERLIEEEAGVPAAT